MAKSTFFRTFTEGSAASDEAIRALESPALSAEAMEWAAKAEADIGPSGPSTPFRQCIEEQRAK